MQEKSAERFNETGQVVMDSVNNGPPTARLKDLDSSYKWVGYTTDAIALGGGIGLTWYALKKLVERAYQRRMEKALKENTTVADMYKGNVTPVTNEFITEPEEPYHIKKEAKSWDSRVSVDAVNSADLGPEFDLRSNGPNSNKDVVLKPGASVAGHVAAEMSQKPGIYHSLAFASLPALVALSSWGANALAKQVLNKSTVPDIVPNLKPEVDKARKKYHDAAVLLRYIASGKAYEKDGSFHKEGQVKEAMPWLPILLGGAGLTALGGYGYDKYKKWQQPSPENTAYIKNDTEMSSNPVTNKGINLALGLGALALLYPGYKFVQSMRKAYNDRKDQVSEATQAAQSWWPLRKRHQERFVRLQAALAQEPELLDELEQTLREKQLLPAEQPTQTV